MTRATEAIAGAPAEPADVSAAVPAPVDAAAESGFAQAHAEWHVGVEAGRTAPHGPLSVTALHWLGSTPQRYPDVPGEWSAHAGGIITAVLTAGDGVSRDGVPLTGSVELGPLSGIEGIVLDWGEKKIDVAARSGRIALRPRDPLWRDRAEYTGTATFPPDENWVVTARFEPVARAGVEVASAAGADATQHYDSPGTAEFEIDGSTYRLTLFGEAHGPDLRAVFADATGADGLTFPAARFVSVARTGEDVVTIDFNRTTNPPCAYSASATCPFPPPENRLPVRIEAGELRPGASLPGDAGTTGTAAVAFDEREYRNAMGGFASGVTVITTHGTDGPVGFTCQSFYSVSIDPPLISFSIARSSQSLAAVRAHGQVVVNFLSADQQRLSGQFARSGTDKWAGVDWHPSEANGAPTLNGVTGWVAGEIDREIEAGDHLIFLVRVLGISTDPTREPLLFYRGAYRGLIEYEI